MFKGREGKCRRKLLIQDEQKQKKYQSLWLERGKADVGPTQPQNRPGKGWRKCQRANLCVFSIKVL